KQLIPEVDKNVHNNDDLTKTLLKETSVLKPRRLFYSSSKTLENSITIISNETSGQRIRELSLSILKSSGDTLTRPLK
ncbi:34190_t:CDS:1, partial [Gigaspora margarita]